MAISGCSNGLAATALATLLLLPAQYYLPELRARPAEPPRLPPRALPAGAAQHWFFLDLPAVDLILSAALFVLALATYLCDWVQRKLMERRLMKLNQQLGSSAARLRGWDARQEQLEATLRMVQNATSEYNLLLYLLLRHRGAARKPPPAFFEKQLDDFELLSAADPFEAGAL